MINHTMYYYIHRYLLQIFSIDEKTNQSLCSIIHAISNLWITYQILHTPESLLQDLVFYIFYFNSLHYYTFGFKFDNPKSIYNVHHIISLYIASMGLSRTYRKQFLAGSTSGELSNLALYGAQIILVQLESNKYFKYDKYYKIKMKTLLVCESIWYGFFRIVIGGLAAYYMYNSAKNENLKLVVATVVLWFAGVLWSIKLFIKAWKF